MQSLKKKLLPNFENEIIVVEAKKNIYILPPSLISQCNYLSAKNIPSMYLVSNVETRRLIGDTGGTTQNQKKAFSKKKLKQQQGETKDDKVHNRANPGRTTNLTRRWMQISLLNCGRDTTIK